MITRRLSLLLLVLIFSARIINAQAAPAADLLVPGTPIERQIAGGQTHSYQIKLTAGQFLRAVVEQKGIDVALALVSPDGMHLIESDLTEALSAREPLSFEAKAGGDYRLVVHANGVAILSGAYRVQLELKDAATAQDRKRMAAEQLLIEAAAMTRRKDFQPSIDKRQQALIIWRELEDRSWEGDTLRSIGGNYGKLSRYDKAAEFYEQVLAIRRERKDRRGEANSLSDLGFAYERLSRFDKSLEYFQQALAINQEIKNRREEGSIRNWIGWLNKQLRRPDKAIEYSEQALSIAREVKGREDEGAAINVLANTYVMLGQSDRAIEYGEEYLAIERELKSRSGEATALHNLALFYIAKFRVEKAIEHFEQALALFREMKDRRTEALALRNLGDTYTNLTRFDKTVECYELALSIYRDIKDRQGEALTLGPLANAYSLLGRQDKAIEYFEQALPINREFKNRGRESGNFNGLGNAYLELGKYEKAIEFYEQSLALAHEIKAHPTYVGMLRGNLGEAYQGLGRNDKAIEYAQQALAVYRETKARSAEVLPLIILGDAFRAQAQYPKAILHHEQALRIAREFKNRGNEGKALHGLMLDWRAQHRPGLAAFYGKQAVNLYQEIRSEISKLERETQQSFAKSKEGTYRMLADLLIGEGRLPEAEQVMNLLKQEEYFDFIRRDNSDAPQTGRAQLTAEEEALEKRYRAIADRLAELGAERGTLIDKKTHTPEEEQRLVTIDADLVVAGNAFQKFLDQLATELGSSGDSSGKVFQLRESQGLMEDLRQLGKGTVTLYTLVGEDKYRMILTTADFQKGYEYPIKAAELNRKVLEFVRLCKTRSLIPCRWPRSSTKSCSARWRKI
jgi:tetratricopeptide (TPR) repeat protein